jgi:pimeloyl-ACP methyl ester carboxylesterase
MPLHLEYQWEDPALARFLNRLASFSRLIVFDKRGTGLSDRVAESALPTLEQRMDDIRAVMDAAGSSRAVIFGISEGGPLSTLFAATYPARTTALIMFGAYAKWIRADDYPWAPHVRSTKRPSRLSKGAPTYMACPTWSWLRSGPPVTHVPFQQDAWGCPSYLALSLNPIGRVYYAASTIVCTPASAQEVGLGLGAQAGEVGLRQVVCAGGFTRFRRAAETPFNIVLEARP